MSSLQKSHPLPPPPTGQQQQQPYQQYQLPVQTPDQQQRSKSSFSLRSDKSHKSSGSIGKADLHETSQEKASRRLSLTTKADPRLAMQEAEPCKSITGIKSIKVSLTDSFCDSGHCNWPSIIISTASSNPTPGCKWQSYRLVAIQIQYENHRRADLTSFTADPDRSNPTRSRWERPLDTIRSFEAAIDGNYSRKSYMRTGKIPLLTLARGWPYTGQD